MKKIIIILILIVGLVSCNELDSRLSTSTDAKGAITDLETLEGAVKGVYSRLQTRYLYNRELMLVPELLSENSFIDGFDNTGRFLAFDNFNLTSTNQYVSPIWLYLGRVISQSSYVIREGQKISVGADKIANKNQLIGEMYASRALAYYLMQQFFSQPYNYTADASHLGSPLPDFSSLGGNKIVSTPRSTTKETYDQIIKDLSSALKFMKSGKPSNRYRFNQNSANALFARVYLNMEDWEKAASFADKVIPNYNLISNAEYLNSWKEPYTSETILSIPNSKEDNSGSNSMAHFCLQYYDLFATPDFVSIFSNTDVRKQLYPVKKFKKGDANIIIKYPEPQTTNMPVFRLSELYLVKAEALANIGRNTDAQNALYKIIKRGDNNAAKPTVTGQALKDRILLERRKELAFEGFRLFDLTRNKKTFTKFTQEGTQITIKSPENRTILPIPFIEISATNGKVQQNPGY